MNQLVSLTLDNLSELDDGKVSLMFQRELNAVIEDVKDRPGDATARKVVMTVLVKPGERIRTAEIEVTVEGKVPRLRTRPYQCKESPEGGLLFNASSPDDVDQGTIPFPEERKSAT